MRQMKLSTAIALAVSILTTCVIISLGILFSLISFYLIEYDFRTYLIDQTNDLVSSHIQIDANTIFFKKGPNGETITQRLRNRDLSAIVYDASLSAISTFGSFRNEESKEVSLTDAAHEIAKHVIQSGKPEISHHTYADGDIYEFYTTPIRINEHTVGLVQVARQEYFVTRIITLNILTLIAIIPIGIFVSWLGSYLLTKRALTPLLGLITHIHSLTADNEPRPLPLYDTARDEISLLTHAYNTMLTRVGEGIAKQKQFIANASHELKTPITHAVTSLDVAALGLTDGKIAEAKQDIENAKESLLDVARMTDSLLTLSKLTDKTTITTSSVHIAPVIESQLELLSSRITDHHITTYVSIPRELTLECTREYAQILFLNILSNAVKYNIQGGELRIRGGYTGAKGTIVEITDTGIGVDTKDIPKIFDRFWRHTALSGKGGGHGLGMAIVKEIADLCHIAIHVDSQVGKGTTVTLTQERNTSGSSFL